jgi:KUP system potassium uptake protein
MMQERNPRHPGGIAALGFAALGVVFGDIGTSPLYTLKTVPALTGDGSPATVLGVLSLIVWTLSAITTINTSPSPCGSTMTAKAASSP